MATYYTKEQLMDCSVNRLINIILSMQEENKQIDTMKKALGKISGALNTTECKEVQNASSSLTEAVKKIETRGRKAFTPEQKAASYEEYKRKKREAYWAQKKAAEEQEQNKQ